MLVKELIEKLQKQKQESEVAIMDIDCTLDYEISQIDNDGENIVFLLPPTRKDYKTIKVGFYKHQNSKNIYRIIRTNDSEWQQGDHKIKYVWQAWIPTAKKGEYKLSKEDCPANFIDLSLFERFDLKNFEIKGDKQQYLIVS